VGDELWCCECAEKAAGAYAAILGIAGGFHLEPLPAARVPTDRKYGPCPCGSGRKYKFCCLKPKDKK
jgi:hypothetical protein